MNGGGPQDGLWKLYKMGGVRPAIHSMFNPQNAQQMAFIRSVMKERRKQEMYEIALLQMEAVVFDLETTGFRPDQGDEIISIGAVSVQGMNIIEEFHTLVAPKRRIPGEVEKLTGITNEMVQDAPKMIDALHAFFEFVRRKLLIAHGMRHDKRFLNAALWQTSRINLSHRMLDTMMIADWLHPRKKDVWPLDDLLSLYGIPIEMRHHALSDAKMTAELWFRMLQDMDAFNVKSLGDLYEKLGFLR